MAHLLWIDGGLDELDDVRNAFLQKLTNQEEPKRLQATLLSQIQQWEDRIVERVRQSASAVRSQVQDLFSGKIKDVEEKLQETTAKIQQCRKSTNFLETDLDEIRNTFDQLQRRYDQITQPPSVKVYEEPSGQIAWDALIYAEDESSNVRVRSLNSSERPIG